MLAAGGPVRDLDLSLWLADYRAGLTPDDLPSDAAVEPQTLDEAIAVGDVRTRRRWPDGTGALTKQQQRAA